ncbi:hypothetical protein D1BOALGB6SA_9462 [Olavius sp. associated proteobacterium Delta 1]|nr:hypothetical protein D1BOALGB6SA_9462 [Olavius sp. associated proteobacterium Delta 1]
MSRCSGLFKVDPPTADFKYSIFNIQSIIFIRYKIVKFSNLDFLHKNHKNNF